MSTEGKPKPRGPYAHGRVPRTKENSRQNFSKQCVECGETKTLDQFHRKKYPATPARDPNNYVPTCKDCTRAVNSTPRPTNITADLAGYERMRRAKKKKRRDQQAAYKRQYRRETRIQILQYLARHGCEDCGENDPRVLEFDHQYPAEKRMDVSRMVSIGYRWTDGGVLDTEIKKCRIICANCHRLHTIKQQAYYTDPDIKAALDEIISDYGLHD